MKFDLKKPCKNCPFNNTEHRITFACRDRAEEIEEIAYREGFVCHEHGEEVEDYEGSSAIHFRTDGTSQHCVGALYMYLRDGNENIPWSDAIEEDEDLERRWWDRADLNALESVFENEDDFLNANVVGK